MNNEPINERERRLLQRQMFALEDEKEAVEARYKSLLEQARVGVFTADVSEGRALSANDQLMEMFLCDDLKDLEDHVMNRLGSDKSLKDAFFNPGGQIRSLKEGEGISFSVHTFRKNGDSFWARIILQSLKGGNLIEGIVTDITAQVKSDMEVRQAIVDAEQAQQEAEKAQKEAEEASLAKTRFLANISHEIRTPLNGIIGFAEIIMSSISSPEGQLYAGKILDESDNLMTLINQLLDIAKIEANQLQLDNHAFRIRTLMEEAMSFVRPRADNKGLRLSMECSDDLPCCIFGDSYRLRQVLLNLLSNAVKFTSDGSVTLKALVEERRGEELSLRFEVHDTGIGIAPEKYDAIFESFVQADSSITRQYGGTGLGVSISKEIVNLMNGRIWFDSNPGKGSSFYFSIRCVEAEGRLSDIPREKLPLHQRRELLKGRTVLVVEDYPTNREIARHHLVASGCRVSLADNGRTALERFRDAPVDVVLMDLHMPEMDGLEAAGRIREFDKDIPIIGMTADVLPSRQKECRDAGMNDVLNKPLRRKDLLETIEFWLRQRVSPGSAGGNPHSDHAHSPAADYGKQENLELPLDFVSFLEDMEGDRESACEIILGFMDALSRQITVLEKALDERDFVTIHREAHSIKGGALNLGARELSRSALALEKAALSGEFERVKELFEILKQSIHAVLSSRDSFSLIG